MSSCELRADGWPVPEHVDCFNEIKYLRERVEVAEAAISATRAFISPTMEGTEEAVVYAANTYADFLGNHQDPTRRPRSERPVHFAPAWTVDTDSRA